MSFPRPPAVKVRPRPVFTSPQTGGEIVPYRPPQSPLQDAQVINPVPRGTLPAPQPSLRPQPISPDIIDGEIVPAPPRRVTQPARRPVVDNTARPSSQSRYPDRYPSIPNPLQAWKTLADHEAWLNGMNKSQIDEEYEAYEFTKDWGKAGGMLYPYTEYGPRTPIIGNNFDLANKYRARNGLPAIDRFGYEQSQPLNPGMQPGGGFSSNPFKVPLENVFPPEGTPSNFDGSPYDFSLDPDTGLPFTDLQKRRGDELGRPPWHINPVTGNPWGSDEPGSPLPNPFDGYPGGAIRFPVPDYTLTPTRWIVVLELSHSNPAARGRGRYEYYVDSKTAPSSVVVDGGPQDSAYVPSGGSARILEFQINGTTVASNGSGDVAVGGDWENFGVNFGPAYPVGYSASDPQPGEDPTARPFGAPAPLPVSQPVPAPLRRPAPQPVQDPRVSPDVLTPPAINPGAKPNDSPYTPPRPTAPGGLPGVPPIPSLPGSPYPPYAPTPYPRTSPTGTPQPSLDPATQPNPARPSNPAPYTQTERTKNPPVNPTPKDCSCSPCPDPCPPEELKEIQYREFKGCFVLPSGAPDRFTIKRVSVPIAIADFAKNTLDSLADLRASECEPCCFWDIEKGNPALVYEGTPAPQGQNVLLPLGCNGFVITYNASEALQDKSLRNMRRFTNPIADENIFINAAIVYIVNATGSAIHSQEMWVPRWEFTIPMEYRDERITVRIMPKGVNVRFKITDSGARWVQKLS